MQCRAFPHCLLSHKVAGLGGAVYVHLLTGVDPTAFPVQASIDVVAMTVIG
jgi:ABC-type branched-subunit amino acid transport system permease subunit